MRLPIRPLAAAWLALSMAGAGFFFPFPAAASQTDTPAEMAEPKKPAPDAQTGQEQPKTDAAPADREEPKPPAAIPEDYDFRKIEGLAAWRESCEFLGLKFDDESGKVLSKEGKPLSAAQLGSLFRNYDNRAHPMGPVYRTALQTGGFRFDEKTGAILRPDTKQPITRIQAAVILERFRLQNQRRILERIHHVLAQQDPDKPLSADARAEIERLARIEPSKMPEGLMQALNGSKALQTAALRKIVSGAYTDATRFWDGQKTLLEHVRSALPVVPGYNEPPTPPSYFDDTEQRLGKAMGRDIQTVLSGNPVGKELIERYRKPNGELALPRVLVLKLGSGEGKSFDIASAIYSTDNDSLIFNHRYAYTETLRHVPKDQLAAMKVRLADPKALSEYLLGHPDVRRALIENTDVTVYHELWHGWQDQRDRISLEMSRGNVPGGLPLEWEHEAYSQQMRYLHAKFLADPESVPKSELGSYQSYLADADGFRDAISQLYLQQFSQSAAALPTLGSIQKERVGVARRLMGEGLYQWAVGKLKQIGFAQGDTAIEQAKTNHRRRMDDIRKAYPGMQLEGYDALSKYYADRRQPGRAFVMSSVRTDLLVEAKDERAEAAIAETDKAFDAALAALKGGSVKMSLADRARLLDHMRSYALKRVRDVPELENMAVETYRSVAKEYLTEAEAQKDPVARAHCLEYAENYAQAIGDQDLLESIKRLREARKAPR